MRGDILKKGQLQLQESIFVVFIFFIILAIGMVVFYQFELRSVDRISEETNLRNVFHMVSYVPSMPELICSEKGITDECIDLGKAKAFSVLDKNYYRDIFGQKKIILEFDGESFDLYEWKPVNYVNERKISSPVSVFDGENYGIGRLEVISYE
jgi:hypothetical protein